MKSFLLTILCAAAFAIALPSWADDIRTERVRFEPGASSAVIEGSITGYETVGCLF